MNMYGRLLVCIACEDESWQDHLAMFYATRQINGVTYVEIDVALNETDARSMVAKAKRKYGPLKAVFVEI